MFTIQEYCLSANIEKRTNVDEERTYSVKKKKKKRETDKIKDRTR